VKGRCFLSRGPPFSDALGVWARTLSCFPSQGNGGSCGRENSCSLFFPGSPFRAPVVQHLFPSKRPALPLRLHVDDVLIATFQMTAWRRSDGFCEMLYLSVRETGMRGRQQCSFFLNDSPSFLPPPFPVMRVQGHFLRTSRRVLSSRGASLEIIEFRARARDQPDFWDRVLALAIELAIFPPLLLLTSSLAPEIEDARTRPSRIGCVYPSRFFLRYTLHSPQERACFFSSR